jgi:hypothetical protein
MKINQIIVQESSVGSTVAGSVATVAQPMSQTQKRTNETVKVPGLKPAGEAIKAKKKGPYQNSIIEGKKVDEAKLDEEDKIIAVGKGKKLKTGLHGKEDQPRLGKLKGPFKGNGSGVVDGRGREVCSCEDSETAPIIAKALNAYATTNEVKIQGGGALAGGLQYESEEGMDDDAASDYTARLAAQQAAKKSAASQEANVYKQHGITARKAGGDDAYSWAVFSNGRMIANGLSKREVPYEMKKELERVQQKQGVTEDITIAQAVSRGLINDWQLEALKASDTYEGYVAWTQKNQRSHMSKRAWLRFKDELKKQGVAEADKHSMLGKIQRGNELKNKVDSSWKDIGDAQKAGDKAAGSKAFRKHERYANLERPGTWTKSVEEGAKVDRMVGHIKSSEEKAGKSSKEAENIAWATLNKRGMLDNKNKK